jgi:hypothetical protein
MPRSIFAVERAIPNILNQNATSTPTLQSTFGVLPNETESGGSIPDVGEKRRPVRRIQRVYFAEGDGLQAAPPTILDATGFELGAIDAHGHGSLEHVNTIDVRGVEIEVATLEWSANRGRA